MIDFVIIGIYLLSVLFVGFYYSFRIKSVSEYAVAGRSYPIPIIVATIFATIIGGASTMGVAEQFFRVGMIFAFINLGPVIRDMVTAYFIVPRMGNLSEMLTPGDIMERHFGRRAKIITGLAVLTKSIGSVGVQISAMGFLGNYFLGIPYVWAAMGSTATVILYSAFGGVRSVTITDVIQFGVLLVAIPMVCSFGVSAAGGIGPLFNAIPASHSTIFVEPTIAIKYVSLAMIVMLPDLDPAIIQRILMGRTLQQGKTSLIVSAVACLPLLSIAGLIGLTALVLVPNLEPNLALPYLLNTVIPAGAKGIAISGMLAVVMSTADSYLNIGSISLIHDVVRPLKNSSMSDQTELSLMRFGTILLGILAAVCALILPSIFELAVARLVIWKPVIFPPMFLGMIGMLKSQKLFYTGILSSSVILIIWNSFLKSTFIIDGILVAYVAHFLILLWPHLMQKAQRLLQPNFSVSH